jgi:hypothetical protein
MSAWRLSWFADWPVNYYFFHWKYPFKNVTHIHILYLHWCYGTKRTRFRGIFCEHNYPMSPFKPLSARILLYVLIMSSIWLPILTGIESAVLPLNCSNITVINITVLIQFRSFICEKCHFITRLHRTQKARQLWQSATKRRYSSRIEWLMIREMG